MPIALDTLVTGHPLALLFGAGFLSATLLPGGSELLFWTLADAETHSGPVLVAVASLGNTLGGMTNWLLGLWLRRYLPHREPNPKTHRALARLRRWGSPALLFSWLPVVGDPLCLAAGLLGIGPWRALAWIALGKTARYALLLGLAGPIGGGLL